MWHGFSTICLDCEVERSLCRCPPQKFVPKPKKSMMKRQREWLKKPVSIPNWLYICLVIWLVFLIV